MQTLWHHLMTGKVRVVGAIDVGAQQHCAPTTERDTITESDR